MNVRISFNGKEYDGLDAMPEDVRKAYLDALASLRHADQDGMIAVHQSSITFNGRTVGASELPAWARPLFDGVFGRNATLGGESLPAGSDSREDPDTAQVTLGPMLAFMAGFTLVVAIGAMFVIGGGKEHLAGRLTAAIPALLFLGWLDTQATRLARRRESLLGPHSAGYRQFLVWSGLGLLLSAVVLLGLACYMPP